MSKFFKVKVKATVTKVLQVEVGDNDDEDKAAEIDPQCFSLDNDGSPERFDEDVVKCEEVPESDIDQDQPIFDNQSETL